MASRPLPRLPFLVDLPNPSKGGALLPLLRRGPGRGPQERDRKRYDLGTLGENLALAYLEKRGYKLIERNFERMDGEIDLVMMDGVVMVFVEVRTRMADDPSPEDSIDYAKIQQLEKITEIYVFIKDYYGDCRIDAVCIVLAKGKRVLRIKHYKSITE